MAISILIVQLPHGLAQDFKSETIPSKIIASHEARWTLRDDYQYLQSDLGYWQSNTSILQVM